MPTIRSSRCRPLLILSICAALAGCFGSKSPEAVLASVNKNNIQRLANLYFSYQMKHEWEGPSDEAEFKQFLADFNPEKLTRIGIDPAAIDDLFVNERDGQPFKIRYSVTGSMMGCSEPVIFEAEGADGKRMVGFLNMEQREVDEAEYNDLWAGTFEPAVPTRE